MLYNEKNVKIFLSNNDNVKFILLFWINLEDGLTLNYKYIFTIKFKKLYFAIKFIIKIIFAIIYTLNKFLEQCNDCYGNLQIAQIFLYNIEFIIMRNLYKTTNIIHV